MTNRTQHTNCLRWWTHFPLLSWVKFNPVDSTLATNEEGILVCFFVSLKKERFVSIFLNAVFA